MRLATGQQQHLRRPRPHPLWKLKKHLPGHPQIACRLLLECCFFRRALQITLPRWRRRAAAATLASTPLALTAKNKAEGAGEQDGELRDSHPRLTPPRPRGAAQGRGAPSAEGVSDSVQEIRAVEEEGVCVCTYVCVLWRRSVFALLYGSLPCGHGRMAQGGGHLAGRRWRQQTGTAAA